MMRHNHWIAAFLMMALIFTPSFVFAREAAFEGTSPEPEEIEDYEEKDVHADDWFTNPSKNEDYGSENEENSDEESEKKEKPRFIEIMRDDSFIYYMDRKTAHYTYIPHTIKEKMINVWIKLEPLDYAEGDYSYPPKYYLEHYLIRPKRQQIQFLCEMEVAGRPSNDVEDKRYDPRCWEQLIPGSIEDTIYHAVMKHKGDIHDESNADGTSIRDFIENTVNVSL